MRKVPRVPLNKLSGSTPTKRVNPLGNYANYYEFRRDAQGRDLRLVHMKAAWLQGKRMLDIGCNNGWLTLEIGIHPFSPNIPTSSTSSSSPPLPTIYKTEKESRKENSR